VPDPQDIVEIGGQRVVASAADPVGPARPFLAVHFRCCHVYGRMYRNAAQTRYEGRCPRCGAKVEATIGTGGTSRRIFEAG
jgi:hypothetical protein